MRNGMTGPGRGGQPYGRERAVRRIRFLTGAFGVLFIFLCGYFIWFLQVRAGQVTGSPYNARVEMLADRVIRGPIRSADGKELAVTQVDGGGEQRRYYPADYLYVHSVGYSGQAGKTGLEALHDYDLVSSHVGIGRKLRNEVLEVRNPGDTLVTTLDAALQETADEAMGDSRGAVIAMEPDTGRILAMVSQPNFNANEVDARWDELLEDEEGRAPLLNRAAQGLYPPGSTFKIVTVLEYIREHPLDWQDFRYDCGGTYASESGFHISCYHGEAHGEQNLVQAFANSCNGAFARIGEELDPHRFRALCESLLFNRELPYGLPASISTFALTGNPAAWERAQTAIGQGKTMMTPLLNLMIVSAAANGGVLMRPHMADHMENASGRVVKRFLPESAGSLMSAGEAEALTEFMEEVVRSGTGSAFRDAPYAAAGKTGTAETGRGEESHAWFVGFAPADDPEIAICVLVENGGSGGKTAAPIARKVIDAYLER